MSTKEIFSFRLNELIQRRKLYDNGFKKQVLAKALYVTPQTVSRWCNGQILPDDPMLNNIAVYFSVSIDYLKGKTDFKNNRMEDPYYINKLECEIKQGNAIISLLESLGYTLSFEEINLGGFRKKVNKKYCRELELNHTFECKITTSTGESKSISEADWKLFERELLRYANYVISDLLKDKNK